ncbi:MAG: FHA domain-containing protein [Gemmataceae bacterium]|nr:FHA domain-containing protein [Gemmataceae bacterium]
MDVRLIVTVGKDQGREIPLPSALFLIGRDRQCHLRLHCRQVSKRHCAIACWAGKVVVRDLKSRNGTFVNGQRIHSETRLRDSDALKVGSCTFTVRLPANAENEFPLWLVHEGEVRWLLKAGQGPQGLHQEKTQELDTDSLLAEIAALQKSPSPSVARGDEAGPFTSDSSPPKGRTDESVRAGDPPRTMSAGEYLADLVKKKPPLIAR